MKPTGAPLRWAIFLHIGGTCRARRERTEPVNLTTTVNQKQLLDILLNVGLVRPVFIWGQPGIGKSSIVEQFAAQVGLPMGCFAVSILSATRLTGSTYPTTNFAGQMGTAQCDNTKEALQACWISVAFAWVFVIIYSFVGPMILG